MRWVELKETKFQSDIPASKYRNRQNETGSSWVLCRSLTHSCNCWSRLVTALMQKKKAQNDWTPSRPVKSRSNLENSLLYWCLCTTRTFWLSIVTHNSLMFNTPLLIEFFRFWRRIVDNRQDSKAETSQLTTYMVQFIGSIWYRPRMGWSMACICFFGLAFTQRLMAIGIRLMTKSERSSKHISFEHNWAAKLCGSMYWKRQRGVSGWVHERDKTVNATHLVIS
jgi:hypothetical protein